MSVPQRLFQPILANPLHGGIDTTAHTAQLSADNSWAHSSTASPRPILKVRSPVPILHPLSHSPQQSHSRSRHGLHVRWSEPLCKSRTYLTPLEEPTPPLAQEPSHSFSLDDFTMEIVPAYLLIANQQGKQLSWTMPTLSQAGSNLEDVTRANLLPFIASKLHVSVQPAPQLHSSPPRHFYHHTPLHYTWQPASSSPTWSTIKSKHVREDDDAENEPVTSTGDSSSYVTDDDSDIPRNKRMRPSSHTHGRSRNTHQGYPVVLKQSLKNNTPYNHLSFSKQQDRPLTKFQIYDWVNDLNCLWYLMEQGKYTQNEHERLISLLRKINKEKDRPGLDLKWLKESKLVEVLKKYRKEESLQEYDPWVRRTTSQIIRAWKARFEVHSNL